MNAIATLVIPQETVPYHDYSCQYDFQKAYQKCIAGLSYYERLRVHTWFDFLKEHKWKCVLFYDTSLQAILNLAEKKRMIFDQTKYEQQLSFTFYNTFIQQNPGLELDEENAVYLFSLAYAFSKYPGMLRQSLHAAVKMQSTSVCEIDWQNTFNRMFASYNAPALLVRNLPELSSKELEHLMLVARGESLRKVENNVYRLSKNENRVLFSTVFTDFFFKDSIMLRACIAAKLLVAHEDLSVVRALLANSRKFRYNPEYFLLDIDFYKEVVHFFSRNKGKVSLDEFVDLTDYFDVKSYASYTLKDKSLTIVREEVGAWEVALSEKKPEEVASWTSRGFKSFYRRMDGHLFRIVEITTAAALFREGQLMQNCLYTYLADCKAGNTAIFSLQLQLDESRWKSIANIELAGNDVVQFKAKQNKKPSNEAFRVLFGFVHQNALKINFFK